MEEKEVAFLSKVGELLFDVNIFDKIMALHLTYERLVEDKREPAWLRNALSVLTLVEAEARKSLK